MSQAQGRWEGKPVRAFMVRAAAFLLPLVFAILVAWQVSIRLPKPTTIPGVVFWWLVVVVVSTIALRLADRVAKRLMPLAVLMNLSLVFPDKAPSRFGVSMKSGNARRLEELIEEAEAAGKSDDLSQAAETILALAAALNAHDPRTRGHGDRVRAYADMIGEEMGFTDAERNKLKWAAMLHDIGKLRVPSEIINKPGKLDDDEWAVMRNHPNWGMELAAPLVDWLGDFAFAIGQHHERFDGAGYPNGLAGEEIALPARITSVADTYDVMTSVRSYKEARPASEAREELARCAGSQFDPEVVRAFLNISLGRQRWVAGPLSWLAQVPFFQAALQGATTAATHAGTAVSTVAAATAVGATAVVAPGMIHPPQLEAALPPVVIEAPEFAVVDDAITLEEDGTIVAAVLGNDLNTYPNTLRITRRPANGEVDISGGQLSYTPDADFAGTDSFEYEVCGASGCGTATVTVEVEPRNDAPVVGTLASVVGEDEETWVDVLGSATDADGDALSFNLTSGAANGMALVSGNGVTYRPKPDFSGIDYFTVSVCDAAGACTGKTVSVTVSPVNDLPKVTIAASTGLEDTATTIPVDASDVDGDVVTGVITTAPGGGTAVVNAAGDIVYTPGPDFFGSDSFTYQGCDPAGGCVTQTVSIYISPVPDAPVVPGPGPLTTAEDTPVSFDPLAGARDADGDPVSLDSFDAVSVAGGSVASGSLIYTPAADWWGSDSFTYTATDGTGQFTTVVVAITVTPVNDPPVGTAPSAGGPEDTPLVIDLAGAYTDVDGDTISISALDAVTAAGGTVVDNGDGTVTYTPPAEFAGTDNFSYSVSDGTVVLSGTVTTTIVAVNDAPTATGHDVTTPEDTAVVIDVLIDDTDAEGDPLSIALVSDPAHGSTSITADDRILYVPDADYSGPDSFTYVSTDGFELSAPATVTITVTAVNDVPVANDDDGAGFTTLEDTPFVTASVVGNDTDVEDGVPASVVTIVGPVPPGLVNNGDGTFGYNPPLNSNGDVVFSYTVEDSGGATSNMATVTITVTPVNDAPVAAGDSGVGFQTAEDTPFTSVSVVDNDTDVEDGSPVAATVTIVGATPPGLVNNGDGTFDYSPPLNSNGDVAFTYTVDDSEGAASNVATVTITVTPVNDAPVAADDSPTVAEDTPAGVTFNVLDNDTDVDLDFLSVGSFDDSSIVVGSLVDNGGGSFTYTAPEQFFGSESFTYVVTDGLATATGTVIVTVTNVPDAPQAQNDAFATTRDNPVVVAAPGVLGNDTDYDGDILIAALASPPTSGGVTLNPDGSFTYTPNPGFVGNDSFSYTADDGLHPPVAATVDVVVDDGVVAAGWFFGDSGIAPETYAFVDAPPPLGNPDPDGDGNPGLTILSSGGDEDETDPLTFQQWLLAPTLAPVELNGPVTLKLWSTVEFFDPTADVDLTVWVHDCDPTGSVCGPALLNYDVHTDEWNGGVADFVYREVVLGALDHTVAVGRSLRFRLQFDHEAVWVGMSTDYPTEVVFTEANRPPATAPDSASLLEDGGPVNVDVLANDSDPNLDPSSLAIDTPPPNGTAVVAPGPTIDYDPNPDYFGVDSFVYEICDTSAACSTETVSVSVTSVNDVPSFVVGSDELILEDAGGQTVDPHPAAISPGPANEAGQSVSFTVSNDNPALFKTAPTIDPGGKLQYEAWDDVSGVATVTVSISDDGGTANGGVDTSADQTFTITVTGVNDQPDFSDGPNVTVLEDGGAVSFAGWATAITAGALEEEPPAQALTFNILTNSNPGLFSAGPAIDPATGDLTFTIQPDVSGSADLDINLTDDGGTANGGIDTSVTRSFTITVDPVNDEPTFTAGANVTVLEDSGAYSASWATAISMGPPDESTQTGTFNVTGNTVPGLFAAGPSIAADGTLTFTPAANANGSSDITVELQDDGGTADGGDDTSAPATFTITVDPVNDGPNFATGADVTVLEDSGPHTFAGWATGITAGAPNEEPPVQTLTFTITSNDNGPLFASGPTVDPITGDLTFSLTPDANGTANVQLRLSDDGGTANGGDDTSPVKPFRITAGAVNDAPSFTKGSDVTVTADSGAHSFVGWATGISEGPADESSQSVTFNVTGNTDPTLFAVQPQVSFTGTLLFTVAAGQSGTATVTLELQDNGGTANGGVDTSPSQSFDITVSPPKAVISEFRPTGPGGAQNEFVEIFNPGSAAVDLTGWKLHITSGIDLDYYVFPAVSLAPGQHYLVTNAASPIAGMADGTYAALDYGTGFGDIQLLDGSGAQIDALHYGVGPTIGEGAPLPGWGGPAATEGSYERLAGDPYGNCLDTDSNTSDFVRNYGKSNPQNMAAPATPCSVPPVAGSVIIAEFRPIGPAGAEDEFVEVLNPTAVATDISGWTLDVPTAGVLHTFQPGTILGPGQRYVVAAPIAYTGFKDDDYNGGVPTPWLATTHSLQLKNGATVIDAVAWGGAAGGEGTSLPSYVGLGGDDLSYDRGYGGCTDLGDNLLDFVLSFGKSPGTGPC
jgi:hypothetical protein